MIELKNNFKHLEPAPYNKLAWIVSGVTQSDGSFGISFKMTNSKFGYKISPFYRIELTLASINLINTIHKFFNNQGANGRTGIRMLRGTCYYEITDLYSLWHVVVPHFLKYPLYGYKQIVFYKFVQILALLYPYFNKKYKPDLIIGKILYLTLNLNLSIKKNGNRSSLLHLRSEKIYNKINLTPLEVEKKLLNSSVRI